MVAPVLAPPVTGISKTASRWRMSVDTAYDPDVSTWTPDWVEVYGISNLSPGTVEYSSVDDTDYDGVDGSGLVWASNVKVGASWKLSGTHTTKVYGGARDPGAAWLEDQSDANTAVHVRWFDRAGVKAYEGYGDVSWTGSGGAATDLSSATFEIAGKGPRAVITNPVAVAVVPDATSASPTTGPVGTPVTITGTNFVGITSVKFGATNAGLFDVVSDTQIKATVPVGIATGSQQIKVTNAAGDDSSLVAFTVT